MSKHGKLPFNPIIWPAVPHDFTGNNNLGYYTTETTQRYVWGTRGITWDGKVFKYSRAKDTIYPSYGAVNAASITIAHFLNTNHTKTIEVGDRSVLFKITSGETYGANGLTEDELAGGQYVVGHGSGAIYTEQRTVIGNTTIAASTTATIMIYLDAPFGIEHATGFNELTLNPYGYLTNDVPSIASVMGIPNIKATTGQHLWIQTWGLCFIVPVGPDATPGDTQNDRRVVFVGNHGVIGADTATLENGYQDAGFITDATEGSTGCMPMVMLQLSI